jgi:hypothetical protein
MDIKKFFLWGMIFSLIASGLMAIFIFLFVDFNTRELKILFSTLDIGACSLAGLCCSTVLGSRYKWFGILGIIIAALCMGDMLYTIWRFNSEDNFNVLLTLVILAATCSHISLMLLTKTDTSLTGYVLLVTVFFIALVGFMLLRLIWQNDQNEFFYRLLGVFGILDVLGTIITPILGKNQRYEDVME